MVIASFPKMEKTSRNPYLDLLGTHIKSYNIEVDDSNSSHLSIRWLIRNKSKIDLLHLHWLQYHYIDASTMKIKLINFINFLTCLRLAKMLGFKIVWTSHNVQPHENLYPTLDRYLKGRLLRCCDAVLTHSQYGKNHIMNNYQTRCPIYVIKHPNYIGVYSNTINRDLSRKHLNIQDSKFVFSCIGEIRKYKGITNLIETFKKIEGDNVVLIIAGNPLISDLKHELTKMTASDTRIIIDMSYISDDMLHVYINASNFVVLPFSSITMSGSLMLAMSFSRPVIIPDIGGLGEYVNKNSAIIYDHTDKDGLLVGMKRSMNMDWDSMGKHAYQQVVQYTPDNMARETSEIYLSCFGT